MSVPRFHCARTFAAGERTALPDDVFHHAARVRRLRSGDEIVLFAGDGAETRARLTAVTRSAAEIAILDVRQVERESPLPVTLIQGISAGDRMDYSLQKAVELGIAAIVPAFAERSVVRLGGEGGDQRRAPARPRAAERTDRVAGGTGGRAHGARGRRREARRLRADLAGTARAAHRDGCRRGAGRDAGAVGRCVISGAAMKASR
jgi:hypothetical protein